MNLRKFLQTSPLLTDIQRRNLNTASWLYSSDSNATQSGRTFLIATLAVVHATENPELPIKVVDHVLDEQQDERMRAMLKYVLKRLDDLLADGTNRFRNCFKIFKSTKNGPPVVMYDDSFNLDTEETDYIPDLVAAAEFYYDYRDVTWEPVVPDVEVELLPPIPPKTTWNAIRTWWMDLLWEYPEDDKLTKPTT